MVLKSRVSMQTANTGPAADELVRLAEAVGMDKGQISRALAELVEEKLVAKLEPREVLVGLIRAGLTAHDAIVAGAQERNRRLLEQLSQQDLEGCLPRSIV